MKVVFEEVDLKEYKRMKNVLRLIWSLGTCGGFTLFMIIDIIWAAFLFVLFFGLCVGYLLLSIEEKWDPWYGVCEEIMRGRAKVLCFQDGYLHIEQEDKEVEKLSISELRIAERTDIDEIVINVEKLKLFVPYGKPSDVLEWEKTKKLCDEENERG